MNTMNTSRIHLSDREFAQLHQALVSAFPSRTKVADLVLGLHKNLEVITGAKKLSEVVFELIQWTEAYGRLVDLVTEAYRNNHNNSTLKEFVKRFPHLVDWETLKDTNIPTEDLFPLDMSEASSVVLPAWLNQVPKIDFTPEQDLLKQFETWALNNGWVVSDGGSLPLELRKRTDVMLEYPTKEQSIRIAVLHKSRNGVGAIRVDSSSLLTVELLYQRKPPPLASRSGRSTVRRRSPKAWLGLAGRPTLQTMSITHKVEFERIKREHAETEGDR